ncbi:MAG: hypothetical protein OIF36_04660 [Alphaproteobacteria bacterium]|nr:hypothetical protein [Alphaproteobacteria bacterium]
MDIQDVFKKHVKDVKYSDFFIGFIDSFKNATEHERVFSKVSLHCIRNKKGLYDNVSKYQNIYKPYFKKLAEEGYIEFNEDKDIIKPSFKGCAKLLDFKYKQGKIKLDQEERAMINSIIRPKSNISYDKNSSLMALTTG